MSLGPQKIPPWLVCRIPVRKTIFGEQSRRHKTNCVDITSLQVSTIQYQQSPALELQSSRLSRAAIFTSSRCQLSAAVVETICRLAAKSKSLSRDKRDNCKFYIHNANAISLVSVQLRVSVCDVYEVHGENVLVKETTKRDMMSSRVYKSTHYISSPR